MNESKLNISRNIKKLLIGDGPEYIAIDLDDQTLLPSLTQMTKELQASMPGYETRAKEIDALPAATVDEQIAKLTAMNELNTEVSGILVEKLNAAFHENVCQKVYGNIQPDIYALSELLVQLCEETRAAMEEKNKAQSEKLRKYTAKYQK